MKFKSKLILAKLTIAASLLFILSISGCSNENEDFSIVMDQALSTGAWEVSYFFDKDKDETSDFAGYNFTFSSDGKATANKNNASTIGTWSIITDDGYRKFVLNFGIGRPLEELNDDWIIVDESQQLIKLTDDNDTHLEELQFSRK